MKRLLLYAAALLLLLSLLLSVGCGEKPKSDGPALPDPQIAADGDEAPIQWQEPVLEALVREKLGKPEGDIYPSELDDVTNLHILGDTHLSFASFVNVPYFSSEEYSLPLYDPDPLLPIKDGVYIADGKEYQRGSISSLADLAHFHNLYNLHLYKINLTDLSGLEGLPLGSIFTIDCGIRDLEALSQVKTLTNLFLINENIENIEPLRELTGLMDLNLDGSPIRDVSPLRDLPKLVSLSLTNTELSELGDLADIKSLEEIMLLNSPATDLSPLLQLPNLKRLRLINQPLAQKDWEAFFAAFPRERITLLELYRNQITDIRFLEGMENLEVLCLDRDPVADLSPVQGLSTLRILSIRNLKTDRLDLSPLAGLRLKILEVRQDQAVLEGLSVLEGMSGLESLTILDSVGLAQEDIDRLRAALPDCEFD